MIYRPIVDIIEEVVTEVRNDFTSEQNIPFYDYGTTLEVVNRLRMKTDSNQFYDKKYPLIWYVIGDSINEEVDSKKATKRQVKSNTIIICTKTKAEYSSKERYTNVIKPILRPLYDLFMLKLKQNKTVRSIDGFKHEYYENLFWGRAGLYGHDGNIFNDRLDAIIIDSMDLFIIETC